MQNVPHVVPASQPANHKRAELPYNPLDVKCPRCGTYAGKRCVSSQGKPLRYAHTQRLLAAAVEFRSEIRRQNLDRARRRPFAIAFSPRRLSQSDSFEVRIPKEGPPLRSGERSVAPQGNCDAG